MTKLVLFLSLGALLYVYAGYPLILEVIVWIRGPRRILRGPQLPPLTLIISAYNERAVIAGKIQNALALDYPRELLEIVVVSDASSDGTDEIVAAYADRGVRLARQSERRGKTAGLNAVMPSITSDLVVFSDANAIYEPSAIRALVRNFGDPQVGCVTGEARYLSSDASTAATGERAYWRYEIWIKRLETAVGSMVGGDGAIYAIRRDLWRTLPDDAINDFLNPLQIVRDGWRAVYESEAVCYEEPAGTARREWHRRVRIVSRSWRAVFQASGALNPLRVGWFAVCLVSHKVLRWLTGVFLLTAALSSAALVARAAWPVAITVPVLLVLGLWLVGGWRFTRQLVALGLYYVIITVASLVGLIFGVGGRVSGVWNTPRAEAAAQGGGRSLFGILLLALVGAGVAGSLAILLTPQAAAWRRPVFWSALAVLVYIYAGYPVLVAIARPFARRPVSKAPFEPTVCLFIAANDEAAVMEAKLRNSLSIDYPPEKLQVLVASDGSVDGTNEIVRAFASDRVRLFQLPERRGKISAITAGMAGVDAEIVVFSDANTFIERGAIRAMVANFADGRVGAVSGDVVLFGGRAFLGRHEDLYYRYERWLQGLESELGSMLGVDGGLYAIRRALFVAPRADTILDDMAIPLAVIRAGYRIVFEPHAIAHEQGSETAMEEFSRKVRIVAGGVQFLLRDDSSLPAGNVQVLAALVSHKALRWLSPVIGAVLVVATFALAADSRIFLAAAVAQVVFAASGLLGCAPAIRRWSVVGLVHYFWLVQVAALVGFARGLRGGQPVAWRRFARVQAAS